MPDLAAFQAAFAEKLTRPSSIRDGMAVYRNNWLRAAIDAVADLYPTVRRLIGNKAFESVGHDYVRDNPPASPILSRYGVAFPEFLCDQPWVAELPYLPDVAAIDRLYLESLLSTDAPPLEPSSLAGVAPTEWATLRLRTHPAMRIGWFTTPAPSIWLAHRDAHEPGELAPEWQAEGILLTRPGLTVEARAIDRAEHRLLFGMRIGESVGEAALAASNLYPQTDFAGLFARTLESGTLAAPLD
jgi:hypothetical protein